tara:strand:+ start:282 stop:821 length:540 start_codon:yes stop_codon:yes gene_type:complete
MDKHLVFETESLKSDNTNQLPNPDILMSDNTYPLINKDVSVINNISSINSLDDLLKNKYDDKIINCLPCKALQTYSELYKHYINVRNDVKNSLLKCGIENTNYILDIIENENIKCKNNSGINNLNDIISEITDNNKNKKRSYILIFIQLIILLMFGLFIYFFERRRCICICPPGATPKS